MEEIAHGVAKWGALPVLVGDAVDAEQNLRDFALAGAMLTGVDSSKHNFQPATLLGSYAPVGRNPVASKVP